MRRSRPAIVPITLASIAALAWSSGVLAAPNRGTSSATISGSFQDACRDFASYSSKDISHVDLQYEDGRVVKHDMIGESVYLLDGGAGDEIEVAIVKSGTTTQAFTCQQTNDPPTAILEILTPPLERCMAFPFPERPTCMETDLRTTWSTLPGSEIGFIFVAPYPPATFRFRGTGSNDPDGDLGTWSIDFGDGTSTSGSWATEPPADVSHTFPSFLTNSTVTLTVTDVGGASDSSSITFVNHDGTPD
jgi:hypothetical protein